MPYPPVLPLDTPLHDLREQLVHCKRVTLSLSALAALVVIAQASSSRAFWHGSVAAETL
jgi:hypothetical protein